MSMQQIHLLLQSSSSLIRYISTSRQARLDGLATYVNVASYNITLSQIIKKIILLNYTYLKKSLLKMQVSENMGMY